MTAGAGYRGRFAPSPTGPLHFGSLLAAFGSWLMARRANGEWWIRIEDLDPPREVAGAAQAQLRTLAGFGLVSDGPVVYQSTRGELYADALDRLLAQGDAFVCRCSRADLAANGGIHRACIADAARGAHDKRSERNASSIRLRVPDGTVVAFDDGCQGPQSQDVAHTVGDVVLRRADGLWAYQLAVVADDATQGVTDVVRGADLLHSTPRQLLLYRRLGLPPPRHAHLPLVLGEDGRKLSKSSAARPVDGDDPLPALRAAWRELGQVPTALDAMRSVDALLSGATARFDPALIAKTPAHAALAALAASHNGFADDDE